MEIDSTSFESPIVDLSFVFKRIGIKTKERRQKLIYIIFCEARVVFVFISRMRLRLREFFQRARRCVTSEHRGEQRTPSEKR